MRIRADPDPDPQHWLRIRIYYYADPDPGSQKCPHGSGSKGVNTKEEKLHQKLFN